MQLIFLAGLIQRFVAALTFAEGMNQQLEARVDTIRGELEQAYQRASVAERQKAAEDERLRIYRDLHDDVGSKLLSIAHAGRDTRLGSLASSALESLRDAVAKANNPQIRFDEFLLQVREEMQLRLTSLGITLGWWQPSEPLDWMLNSAQNHHLQRIFRELVSNIIRHAGATEVKFDVFRVGRAWRFVLVDNGKGMMEQPDGGGGRSLRARAIELGATIAWHSRTGNGVEVVLLLPLQAVSNTDPAP
jgi:signal transduction histidine kinase